MSATIPVVSYFVDGGDPHLVANECDGCGARYLERRNGCGRCGGRSFTTVRAADTGVLSSYTIVHRGARSGPYVAGVFELDDGCFVRANLVGVEPEPAHVPLGAKVRLTTVPVADDAEGTTAMAFAFTPI